jgi:hypothetical protein
MSPKVEYVLVASPSSGVRPGVNNVSVPVLGLWVEWSTASKGVLCADSGVGEGGSGTSIGCFLELVLDLGGF